MQMATGHFLSRLVWAAANLRLADHLASGPKSAEDLSAPTGCDARALHRFMRTLTNFGLLTLGDDARFTITALGAALQSDVPGSVHSAVLTMAGPRSWKAWDELQYSLETGRAAAEKAFGMSFFDVLAQHPDEARRFSETMGSVHAAEPPAVANAYDFSPFGVIVDVGGAIGNMLAHVLTKYPQTTGILFDQAHVVSDAPAFLRTRGVESRVTIASGSFFDSVPAGGDAYILSHVIHDWSDDRCVTILGNCRKAMKPTSKLLLVELVLQDGGAPGFGSADMVMMVFVGGQERTAREFGALLARAGLRLTRVVPTASSASVIEAELA
jgi:hypothetical protein